LIHGTPEKKFELPGKGPYSLYLHDGKVCVGSPDSDEGMFCTDCFQTSSEKAKKREVAKTSAASEVSARKKAKTSAVKASDAAPVGATRSTPLKGMRPEEKPGLFCLIEFCVVVC